MIQKLPCDPVGFVVVLGELLYAVSISKGFGARGLLSQLFVQRSKHRFASQTLRYSGGCRLLKHVLLHQILHKLLAEDPFTLQPLQLNLAQRLCPSHRGGHFRRCGYFPALPVDGDFPFTKHPGHLLQQAVGFILPALPQVDVGIPFTAAVGCLLLRPFPGSTGQIRGFSPRHLSRMAGDQHGLVGIELRQGLHQPNFLVDAALLALKIGITLTVESRTFAVVRLKSADGVFRRLIQVASDLHPRFTDHRFPPNQVGQHLIHRREQHRLRRTGKYGFLRDGFGGVHALLEAVDVVLEFHMLAVKVVLFQLRQMQLAAQTQLLGDPQFFIFDALPRLKGVMVHIAHLLIDVLRVQALVNIVVNVVSGGGKHAL